MIITLRLASISLATGSGFAIGRAVDGIPEIVTIFILVFAWRIVAEILGYQRGLNRRT